MPTRIKITKRKRTYEFVVPVDFARDLGLKTGQSMAMCVDDDPHVGNKICAVPLQEGKPPLYECEIRVLRQTSKYGMSLTIPPNVMKEMELKQGDYLLIRIGNYKGLKFFMLKPDRPTKEILLQDNEDGTTTVNEYGIKPDGSMDTSKPVQKGIVPTELADKVAEQHKTDPESVPEDIFEFKMIRFSVPDNYAGERFLTKEDVQKDKDHKKINS